VILSHRADRDAGDAGERPPERVELARVGADPQVPQRLLPQPLDRGDRDDLSRPQDGHGIRGLLDLAQHVRAQEDRLAPVARLAHHREELLLHERVEAARRLVEHEKPRLVHERLDEPELLLVALGEGPYRAPEVDIQARRETVDRAGRDRPAQAFEVTEKVPALDARFEPEFAWEVSDRTAARRSG